MKRILFAATICLCAAPVFADEQPEPGGVISSFQTQLSEASANRAVSDARMQARITQLMTALADAKKQCVAPDAKPVTK